MGGLSGGRERIVVTFDEYLESPVAGGDWRFGSRKSDTSGG